jgi:uncharacterized membrane protein
MARVRSDVGCGVRVSGVAGTALLGPELAFAGRHLRSANPDRCDVSSRSVHATRSLTFIANGVITVALIASLIFLIQGLPQHRESPKALLRSAAALWVTNILVFALWYWKLDAGGPLGRERRRGRLESSFLFPQMAMQNDPDPTWSPHFMDYLFLAFNTSTAFSPTDTAVLSRWAKAGMMLQALISLSIIALLAARAVNIL